MHICIIKITFFILILFTIAGGKASAVDITPIGIDKGSGLRWLITQLPQEFPMELANIAGIGDSGGDLPFLHLVGFSAAPSNASTEVKAMVSYCSTKSNGQGVVDIMQRCITQNLKYG